MPEKTDNDNVEYLERKPGFYKKGPLEFKLVLGTLEELAEEANFGAHLRPVKNSSEKEPAQPE